MAGLIERACRSLDTRLTKGAPAPLAIAFSGGGDSLALLSLAKSWADGAGRRLVALTVDHGLQPSSADWVRWCGERAARLGIQHRGLRWLGPKPSAGIPAAARRARHELLAEAARALGAHVILMAHTLDDLEEARLMRALGGSVGEPSEWSPSPSWPAGRDVFLLRPLLDVRREALRRYLAAAGEPGLEDPANSDPRFARARARLAIGGGAAVPPPRSPGPTADTLGLAGKVRCGLGGEFILDRTRLSSEPLLAASRLVGAAALCASGGAAPPSARRAERLAFRLASGERFVATLAGARLEAGPVTVRVMREVGEWRRRQSYPRLELGPGRIEVWDGRFELARWAGRRDGTLEIRPLAGMANRIPAAERALLKAIPPRARLGLPAAVSRLGAVTCPVLAPEPHWRVRCLAFPRLAAAMGAVAREADIARHGDMGPGALNWHVDDPVRGCSR